MSRVYQRGLTLVEIMVAMVLGLVIIGGVIGVLLANKRSYGTNQGLSQVQETARTAFELMARDIRQSDGNGCDNSTRTSNLLAAGTNWWQDWYGVSGIDGSTADPAVAIGSTEGLRVDGTDSIHVQGLEGTGRSIRDHDADATTITINGPANYVAGDIMVVCDFDHAAIFQATEFTDAADDGDDSLKNAVGSETPGNCSSGLAFPHVCDGGAGNKYEFAQNAQIGRMQAASWYVGNNGRPEDGGRSLYRRRLAAGGTVVTEEVVSGVTDMQVRYGENGRDEIATAATVDDWANVSSIFITLTADSVDANVTTDRTENSGRIQRTFTYLITLRNRVP